MNGAVWVAVGLLLLVLAWPGILALGAALYLATRRGTALAALMAASLGVRWLAMLTDGTLPLAGLEVWLHLVPLLVAGAVLARWLPEVARSKPGQTAPKAGGWLVPFLLGAIEAGQYGGTALRPDRPEPWPGFWWLCAGLALAFWAALGVGVLARSRSVAE